MANIHKTKIVVILHTSIKRMKQYIFAYFFTYYLGGLMMAIKFSYIIGELGIIDVN